MGLIAVYKNKLELSRALNAAFNDAEKQLATEAGRKHFYTFRASFDVQSALTTALLPVIYAGMRLAEMKAGRDAFTPDVYANRVLAIDLRLWQAKNRSTVDEAERVIANGWWYVDRDRPGEPKPASKEGFLEICNVTFRFDAVRKEIMRRIADNNCAEVEATTPEALVGVVKEIMASSFVQFKAG